MRSILRKPLGRRNRVHARWAEAPALLTVRRLRLRPPHHFTAQETPMTTVDHVLARARLALGRATLYNAGSGGTDPQAALPSAPLAVGRIWPTLTAAQQQELEP